MTNPATNDLGDTADILVALREADAEIHQTEVRKLQLTIEWAVRNTIDPDERTPGRDAVGLAGDRGLELAGPGAPLVSEFALMEYAAALGMSTDAGKAHVGTTLELRYRLPRLWQRVLDGKVPVWRARRIAEQTQALPAAGPPTSTEASPTSPTPAPGPSSTTSSTKPSPATTPTPPRPSAGPPPTAATSPSTPTAPPSPAPSS